MGALRMASLWGHRSDLRLRYFGRLSTRSDQVAPFAQQAARRDFSGQTTLFVLPFGEGARSAPGAECQ